MSLTSSDTAFVPKAAVVLKRSKGLLQHQTLYFNEFAVSASHTQQHLGSADVSMPDQQSGGGEGSGNIHEYISSSPSPSPSPPGIIGGNVLIPATPVLTYKTNLNALLPFK